MTGPRRKPFTGRARVNTIGPEAIIMNMSGRNNRDPVPGPAGESRPSAMQALVHEPMRRELHRYLLRRLERAEDVEDLAQEVYLRLLRFAQSATVRFPRAYVLRVACNALIEFKYHRNRAPVSFDSASADDAAENLADESVPPEDLSDTHRRESQVERQLTRLTPMQRAVLLLSTRENLRHAQIAERLGISASTARVHLYRAISALREAVGRE